MRRLAVLHYKTTVGLACGHPTRLHSDLPQCDNKCSLVSDLVSELMSELCFTEGPAAMIISLECYDHLSLEFSV